MKSLKSAFEAVFFVCILSISASALGSYNLVVINPGGGKDSSGADGLRFTASDASLSNGTSSSTGGDQAFFKNKVQFYRNISGGNVTPVLAVGTDSFGFISSYSRHRWNNVSISGLTGSASTCPYANSNTVCPGSTGSGSATITYTALVNGQPYTVVRTLTYRYPQPYITDRYVVTVPADGAGKPVKLYYGGDLYPGGQDNGTGQFVTSPVQVLSAIVPGSDTRTAFRQASGQPPFSRYFSARYSDAGIRGMQNGADLSNALASSNLDIGAAIQWTLGTSGNTVQTFTREYQLLVGKASDPLPPSPPGAPTGLTATGGNAQADLSWTAPGFTDNLPISGYLVQQATSPSGPWNDAAGGCGPAATSVSAATTCTATGLANFTTYYFRVAATTSAGTGTFSDPPAQATPTAPPTLTELSPDQGPVAGGAQVTLTGTGFVPGMTVNVDGVTDACKPVTLSSQTSASCIMPAHPAGPVNVTVTNPAGTSGSQVFTYDDVPTLTAVSPTAGPTAGGIPLTLTGTAFVSGMTVSVDGVADACKPVTVNSQTSASCTLPPHAAATVNINVTTPGGTSGNQPFTYSDVPSLSAISPDQGPTAGGTSITLTGSRFVAGMTVSVGGNPCTPVTIVSSTEARCTTPPGPAGPADVVASTGGGSSAPLSFTYDNAPSLTAIFPDQGPTIGGTPVTLTGSSFIPGFTTVDVDGQPCTKVKVTSDSSLTCNVPPGTIGAKSVTVTTPGGASGAVSYTYDDVPALTAVSPQQGPLAGGTQITLTGTAFVKNATTVMVGGAPCTQVNVLSETSATCVTPANAAVGIQPVLLTTPGGTSAPQYFTYDDLPTLVAVSPNQGPTAGGTLITLTGHAFIPGSTTVMVAGQPCSGVNVLSDSSLTCTTAAAPAGVQDVQVSTPGGDSNILHFTYDDIPALTVIAPGQGPLAGGTRITLTGAAFVNGSTSVTVDGQVCTGLTVISHSEAACTTPPGMSGPQAVLLTTPGGTSNALHFTYDDVPTLVSVSPDQGPEAGGTIITLTGHAFIAGSTSVEIDGLACTGVQVISDTSLTCKTPPNAAGVRLITVTTPGGNSNPLPYTYDPVPQITAINPKPDNPDGGKPPPPSNPSSGRVTIEGTGFVPGNTTVTVDGKTCSNVNVISTMRLTCDLPEILNSGPNKFIVTTPGGSSSIFTIFIIIPDGKPIPTLSTWGMILLSGLMLLAYGWNQRRHGTI